MSVKKKEGIHNRTVFGEQRIRSFTRRKSVLNNCGAHDTPLRFALSDEKRFKISLNRHRHYCANYTILLPVSSIFVLLLNFVLLVGETSVGYSRYCYSLLVSFLKQVGEHTTRRAQTELRRTPFRGF